MVTVFLRPRERSPMLTLPWRSPSRRSSATACGGITKPVLLLEGFFDARDLPTISAQHFHTAVHNEEQLAALEEASLDEPVTV